MLRPRRLTLLIFTWLAATAVVAWLLHAGREQALQRGERATAAVASILEQHTARTFQAVNLTLAAIGDAHQLEPRPGKNDHEFQRMMARRLGDLPFVRALFIVGADGWIAHDTDYPGTPAVSLADREYFLAHQHNPALEKAFWPPMLSRSGTGWFLPVSHALGRSQEFEGVVVAAIRPAVFGEPFRSMSLAHGDLVALFHVDGTLIASHPIGHFEVGKRYENPLLVSPQPSAYIGTLWTTDGLLPGSHVVSFRYVQGAPYVLLVSRARDDVLAEWRRTATSAVLAMLSLTLILGWFFVRLARERAQLDRERTKRVQAEKLEALGRLSGGMAHDFANLLNIIAVNIALLRMRPGDADLIDQALASVERALSRGKQVVERLLVFARRKPLSLSYVRLDAWLEQARPLLEQAAGSTIAFEIEAHRGLPEVLCDTGELDLVLVNLVINARDAIAGSGRIRVRAFSCDDSAGLPREISDRAARYICLRVEDSGAGMTEEVKRRALEPFYSTKGEGGTGLGLSQAYGFMHQIGGGLSIDSAPGRGTVITLYFPVANAPRGSVHAAGLRSSAVISSNGSGLLNK